jgi:prepilin-type N-terminal cleavage/methylation domain-containing protein
MTNRLRKPLSFTLVEMMVVIAVIAMLVGLLFPAIGSAIRTARRAKAKAEVTQLLTAFKAYYTEFGVWPTNMAGNVEVSTNVFRNSKGIIFYDFSPKSVDFSTGFYLDPWEHPYWFKIDKDYRNYIASPFTPDGNVSGGVLIWSEGPSRANYGVKKASPENREVVTSW